MVKVLINGVERYYDGYWKDNLDGLKGFVERKWDGVGYFGGYEGDGKTTLALQSAVYVDPSFCLDRVVFTPQQFIDAVDKAAPGQAIVYDEAQDAFDSSIRDATSKILKMKLTRIRKKRLYIFIVAADFWRINRYLFIHRSRFFVRIYADGYDRGRFAFYNREKKHQLLIKGKKEENVHVVPPNFIGAFTDWSPLDMDEYESKKDKATLEVGKDEQNNHKAYAKDIKVSQMRLLRFLHINQWLKTGALEAGLRSAGIGRTTFFRYLRNGELDDQKEDESLGKHGFEVPVPRTNDTNNLPEGVGGGEGDEW